MSEMKIPRDSLSIAPKTTPSESSKETTTPPSAYQLDSLEAYTTQANLSTQQQSYAPKLTQPEVYPDSMLAYFSAISGARLALKQQLAASDQMDLTLRLKSCLATTSQALIMQTLIDARAKALEDLENQAKEAQAELQKKIDEMQLDRTEQQKLMDKINQGNALEKQQHQDLAKAYDKYISELKKIGKDQGNGNYTIPEEEQDKYNAITKEYQDSVDKYNTYWKGRQSELNDYNQATMAYNQRAAENSQAMKDLIDKYQLADYMKEKGLPIPSQPRAGLRDLAGAPNQIDRPPLLDKAPADISAAPLNSYTRTMAKSGPPALSPLGPVTSIDGKAIYEGIYRGLYQEQIVSLEKQMLTVVIFWQFTQSQKHVLSETIPDPVLNSKPLAQRILPEGSKAPQKTASEGNPSSMSPLAAFGVTDTQLATILGQPLLRQALESLNLKVSKEQEGKLQDQQIEQIADKLLLLSIGLMGNQSLQSLFPSISPLSKPLVALPADSPVFALLFAVSFANRIQEDAQQGLNKEALQAFIKGIPELEGISKEDQAKLEAALNLGQLLTAVKMLENALGLPGLTAQVLPPLPSLNKEAVLQEGAEERHPILKNLQQNIAAKFIDEGYPKEEAKFLSQVGAQLAEQGALTPSAASIPSPNAINKPLLMDSVKAALVLSKIPIKEADSIAHEAVESTLKETPYSSAKQLRSALETHLQDSPIRDKASEIARQAVVIPPKDHSFSRLPSAQDPAPKPILTPKEIIPVLEKRALELLTPQLGEKAAKELTQEVVKTLVGSSPPESTPKSDAKAPYSLANVMTNVLYHLRLNENKQMTESVVQSFKETIKSMESFYAFSLKLMDPAYLFVYSGIIHGDQGRKKSVDIPI